MTTNQSRRCGSSLRTVLSLLILVIQLSTLWWFLAAVVSAFDIHSVWRPTHSSIRPTYSATSFFTQYQHNQHQNGCVQQSTSDDVNDELLNDADDTRCHNDMYSRRHMLIRSAVLSSSVAVPMITGSSMVATAATISSSTTTSGSVYVPAVRPTVYRVDSTIPPTLLPVPKNQDQKKLLRDLGRGLGTDKKEVFIDRINLNNMLQKAVYGTIDAVKSITSSSPEAQRAPASFVCFGLPMQATDRDIDLTVSLLQGVFEKRLNQQQRLPSAIGIATLPCTAQNLVDDLMANRKTLSDLISSTNEGDDIQKILPLYRPILEYAIENKIPIIAMGLSKEDEQMVQKGGIQNVNPASREKYVKDPNGFIATTNDPKFKLYTDRSLLKDRLLVAKKDTPASDSISEGNYFAERILSHEAGATLVSQYAIDHRSTSTTNDGCVIAIVAPINDVRYLGGINGRIPRIYQYLSSTATTTNTNEPSSLTSTTTTTVVPESLLTMNDITTILINPNAMDTLSRTVRLRLEIGTGPDTIPYQTKIADYLWFSSSPPVNILPRMMDY